MQAASGEVKYEYERCSVCANGRVFSPHTGLFSTCSLCKGRGIIVTSHKCACGAPVTTKSSDSYLYCGKKSCLTDLRADTAEDKVTAERGIPSYSNYRRGWRGWENYDGRWAE